jgi:hypothetical protein
LALARSSLAFSGGTFLNFSGTCLNFLEMARDLLFLDEETVGDATTMDERREWRLKEGGREDTDLGVDAGRRRCCEEAVVAGVGANMSGEAGHGEAAPGEAGHGEATLGEAGQGEATPPGEEDKMRWSLLAGEAVWWWRPRRRRRDLSGVA